MKELTLTKTDLGIIFSCSLILGFSYSFIPVWAGEFSYFLVNFIMPLIIGMLGYAFIFLQKTDQVGLIILCVTTAFSFGFGLWFIIRDAGYVFDAEGYDIFIFLSNLVYYGFVYITPGICCGWRAYEIHTQKQNPSKNVDLPSFFSLVGCSVLAIFCWNVFYILVIVFLITKVSKTDLRQFQYIRQVIGDFGDILMAILSIVSIIAVALGIIGNLKNQKLFLGIFVAFSYVFWLFFFILYPCKVSDYPLYKTGFEGFWVVINCLAFTTFNAYKVFLIHQDKQPVADYDALL